MRFCLVGIIVVAAVWAGSAHAEPPMTSVPASEDSAVIEDALPIEPIKEPVATAVATAPMIKSPFGPATSKAAATGPLVATGTKIPSGAATSTATPPTITTNDDTPSVYNYVLLQGLNKVTGHVSKLDGPVGTVMNFGGLEIIVRRCWKSPPEERPENAALMEIRELKPEEGSKNVFLGWMFSSSPGLSGLEHPVYDVTLLSCESLEDPEKGEKPVATETATKGEKAPGEKSSTATPTGKKPHAATPTAKATATKRLVH